MELDKEAKWTILVQMWMYDTFFLDITQAEKRSTVKSKKCQRWGKPYKHTKQKTRSFKRGQE